MARVLPTVEEIGTWRTGAVEQLHDRLYDRYTMAATLSDLRLFNTPISQTRQGAQLTEADTNVVSANVPSNENWVLHGLGIRYQADEPRTDAEMQLIFDYLSNAVYTMIINGKDEILKLTGDMFWGPFLGLTVPAADVGSQVALGDFYGYMKFAIPIGIVNKTTWHLGLDAYLASDAGLNGDKIRFYFDRELLRQS